MPKIAEIKEIKGGTWVRVEIEGDEGSITLWTEEEKAAAIRAAVEAGREACAKIADDCMDDADEAEGTYVGERIGRYIRARGQ